ncbi:MAG: hypothetical protein FJZ01_00025 [Candidatus Sericytochromatia bacterium]|nr:hypothetical protein [Candidatus Tanganyikabacteria bacterium]
MKLALGSVATLLAISLLPAAFAADRKPVRTKPQRFDLSADEWDTVKAGGITVRHSNKGQVNDFFSAGYVKASVDDVFWYYEDHNNTPKYQNAIKRISVEEDLTPKRGNAAGEQGGYRRLKYEMVLPWPIGTRNFVLDLEGQGEAGKWGDIFWSKNTGGDCDCAADVDEMQGSYVMTPYPDNRKWTLVRYWVRGDMRTWIPGWLVGFIQGRTIPNVIAQARKDLE